MWSDNISDSDGLVGGTMAGPLVVWGPEHALIVAPVTQAMEMNMVWNNLTTAYSAGPLGSIDSLPVNYTVETMLFLGPSTSSACAPFACGPNAAVRGFGEVLRKYKGKDTQFPAGGFDADPTLKYLGYCAYHDGCVLCFDSRSFLHVTRSQIPTTVLSVCIQHSFFANSAPHCVKLPYKIYIFSLINTSKLATWTLCKSEDYCECYMNVPLPAKRNVGYVVYV